jgi:TM2 domain-containing membrane protein YozV
MSAAICPYCRTPVEESEAVVCQGCGTPHHADCLEENGGCTVFGCSQAPPPEPKMSIGAPDLQAAAPMDLPPYPPGMQPPYAAATGPLPPPPPPIQQAPLLTPTDRPLFASLGYGSPVPLPPTPIPHPGPYMPPQMPGWPYGANPYLPAKNRTTYLVLGILLGALGVHNFYAGYIKKGLLQLALTVFTLGFGGFMTWIWAVIDICTVTTDNDGIPFRS